MHHRSCCSRRSTNCIFMIMIMWTEQNTKALIYYKSCLVMHLIHMGKCHSYVQDIITAVSIKSIRHHRSAETSGAYEAWREGVSVCWTITGRPFRRDRQRGWHKKTTKRSSKHYCLSYTGISLEWFNFVIQFRVLISIITYDTVVHRRLDSMRSTNCIFMIMIMWAE